MRRGQIWWVDFDPSLGTEIQKTRPAIIVSNDTSNRNLTRVQVIPLTSNISRVYRGEALVTLNGQLRKAMADQIATVSIERVRTQLGTLKPADIQAVERALAFQLGLA